MKIAIVDPSLCGEDCARLYERPVGRHVAVEVRAVARPIAGFGKAEM